MAELTPDIVGEVIEACRAAAEEISGTITRTLDDQFTGVTIGEGTTYDAASPPEGLDGPGLIVVLEVGTTAVVTVLPESTRLLPDWYANPDSTGHSKLSTLAQELGMLLLPASFTVERFHAYRVDNLAAALTRGELASGAALVPLTLKCDEKLGQMSILWPVPKPGELMPKVDTAASAKIEKEEAPKPQPQPESLAFDQLPKHTRSLFKVRVPVAVNLATQKQSVQDIIELVPGSIIKFDKSCDELLELVVGDQAVAAGEVVKVGDKFGLRIRNMVLPEERFVAIKTTMSSSG